MTIDTLCLGSGGIQGLSFLSSLQYLINNNYIDLNTINTFVGTSIGAVLCFLLIIGYTPDDLIIYLLDYDFSELEPDINLFLLEEKFGLDNGDAIIKLLKILYEKKFGTVEITFNELFILTKKKFILNATNFTKGTEAILSYETTPNLSVYTAIRMSTGIPIIYTPVLYENEYYMDGALINSILLSHCNAKTTLALKFNVNKINELNTIPSLIIGCLLIITTNTFDETQYNILNISTCDAITITETITKEYIQNVFNIGTEYAKYFYITKIKEKINNIKNKKLNKFCIENINELTDKINKINKTKFNIITNVINDTNNIKDKINKINKTKYNIIKIVIDDIKYIKNKIKNIINYI